MKIWNIVILSLLLSLVASFGICELSKTYLGDLGFIIAFPLSFLIGFRARYIVEKIVGYTMEDAIKSDRLESKEHE